MQPIEIASTLPAPQAVVMPRLYTVLCGYAARTDFTMTVELGIAHGAVAVPVVVDVTGERRPDAIPVSVRARERAGWFPVFAGDVACDDGGRLESRLRLSGTYEVPLGPIGAVVDRNVLAGAAERSLHGFLERLRADVIEEIERAELAVRDTERRPR